MVKEVIIQGPRKLFAQLFGEQKDGRLVILFHGHPGDSSGGSTEIARKISASGRDALVFDHRGCGQSEGDFSELLPSTALQDAEAVLAWAHDNYYYDISLVGSSFGGHTALQVALKNDISRMVLRAPAADMSDETEVDLFSSLLAWKLNGTYTQVWEQEDCSSYINTIPYAFYEESCDSILYEAAYDILTPTLILHGDQDTIVPLEQSQILVKNMPNASLIILEGASHQLRIGESREEADELTLDWIL